MKSPCGTDEAAEFLRLGSGLAGGTRQKKKSGKRYRLNLQAERDILKLTDRLRRKNGVILPERLSEQHFFRIVTVSPTL